MNNLVRSVLGVSLVVACSCIAAAQESSQEGTSIPKVLEIMREYVKPGKAGMVHERSESLFVQAMTRAKWPTHYVAMTSLSGKNRALFLTPYASFEAWEKDNLAVDKNATLSAALDRALMTDGELLDSEDTGLFVFRDDLSLRPMADLSHMRYLDIATYRVRPGHTREWIELVKLVRDGYEKGVPDAHWGMFQLMFGGEGGTYLVITARKSLAEVDRSLQNDAQFAAAMGAGGMQQLGDLMRSTVEASSHQLFEFNPRMSYVPDEWVKADPDFWKPKAAAAPAAKHAAEQKQANP